MNESDIEKDDVSSEDGENTSVNEVDATEALKMLVKESEDKYLRLLAEFDNFRKNTAKQRQELLKYEGERIFSELLEVVDNFDLAMGFDQTSEKSNPEKFKEGVELIHKKFVNFLAKWGVKGESAVGREFDPTKQNAISKVPSADADPNTVVAELKKAYFYKDKLIRAGEVVVSVDEQ